MCPGDPSKAAQHDALPALKADEAICWSCTPFKVLSCDAPSGNQDSSGNLVPPFCVPSEPHEHIGRNCVPLGACGAGTAIIDAATLFPDGSAGTAKYLSCG